MNKKTKIIIGAVVVIAIIVAIIAIIMMNLKPKTNLDPITSPEELSKLIDKINGEHEKEFLDILQTQIIDVTDDTAVQSFTGLQNGADLEYLAVSEPLMTAQAYSFVLAKVKDGVNADTIAKTMKDNVDTRKWICVSAERLYCTSSGNVVCLVMSSEERAKPIYEKFKELAGTIGQEYEEIEQEPELPEEMY